MMKSLRMYSIILRRLIYNQLEFLLTGQLLIEYEIFQIYIII